MKKKIISFCNLFVERMERIQHTSLFIAN